MGFRQRRYIVLAFANVYVSFFITTTCVPEETDQLIDQLNHGSLSMRMDAANNLEKLGLLAITAIQKALPKATGEAAFRLPHLLHALVLRETKYFLEPSVVSLTEETIPLDELVKLISQQTNNHIILSDEINHSQAIHFSQTTLSFWKILEEITNLPGCNISFIRKTPGLALNAKDEKKERFVSSTSDQLIRIAIHRTDPLGLDGTKGIRVILRLAWEPRLHPVAIDMPLLSVQSEKVDGQNIPLLNRRGLIEPTPITGRCWVDLPVQLKHPHSMLHDIGSLRGTINLYIPKFEHDFVLDIKSNDLKKGLKSDQNPIQTRVTLDDMTASLNSWKKTDFHNELLSTLTVYTSARFESPSVAFESHRNWLKTNIPTFLFADGVCLTPTHHHVIGRTNQSVSFETSFSVPKSFNLRNTQIKWRLPVGISRHSASFWLRRK